MAAQEKMLQVREDGVYMYVDQMPVYPKGQEGIMQYIAKTVKYPAYARAKGASGTVLVQFVIKKNGKHHSLRLCEELTRCWTRKRFE